ncbi:MAG: polysaccharide deacetylase family protein [Acidobacteriaceae bacterium]|nr:polysaccharide deacetylase family protein [Acidobacteriaceae bacterium]
MRRLITWLGALLVFGWCPMVTADTSVWADRILLLVPDDAKETDPGVTLWLDAASEEGLHVIPVRDSEFIRPYFETPACAGIILPGSIHKQASDAFLAGIRRYVADGGKLMLVYDAGTLSPEGRYAHPRSRISDLAGVGYALYDDLRDKTIVWGNAFGTKATFRELAIPPGKYYPFEGASSASQKGDSEAQLRRYGFGDLKYPSFVTEGHYSGRTLLHSADTIVAGEHEYAKGSVLFVNAPLGYLKSNTDGLLLHAFLNYFAKHMLALPYLTPVPDGVGGLVLNWHIDSNAAIRPLQELLSWGPLLEQGPYSIHVTAGPDARAFGDHLGFDVDHNSLSSELVQRYAKMGNEIGSHGGWIHDYYAAHADTDPAEIEPLLALNKAALERVTGKPVLEYSAPAGNQPPWITQWLEGHGFVAYYLTGNSGMGPTQGYRSGARESQRMWEFPILHLDRAAAFEEMKPDGYSDEEVEQWLESVADFAASNRVVRLVYFHPPGILAYKQVVMNWLQLTARLRASGEFRWYTMTELANFLTSRKRVEWKLLRDGNSITLDAADAASLDHFTWVFSADRFSKPHVIEGVAQVRKERDSWLVTSGSGSHLVIQAEVLPR